MPEISLVLGSGGARGLAHIGVIEWLLEHDYQIRSIAGSSMGALVGGIHAAGKLDQYKQWVTALQRVDVLRLLDLSFTGTSLFKGERIINVLEELIGEHDIENLSVSYTAVATDVDNQKEIWLNQGSLFKAIRASISIPSLFEPYHYMGLRLVDGGLINPIPIAPTLTDRTDITIAVNLSARPEELPKFQQKEINSNLANYQTSIARFLDIFRDKNESGVNDQARTGMFDIMGKSLDILENSIAKYKLAAYSPDVVVSIPRNACAFHEFHRASELIEIGRDRAEKALSNLPKHLQGRHSV